ncbi:hypothetical protein A6E15_19340 [Natrinema saccharevitans]|uniref:Transcription regulator TrmB N-terminal domain-containing protein n=1 Tax=Natrinema saccharevitans TaxID=301967 RepID=A0A1S8ARG6_9EURY|nr:helix-turn-helix domain-containing protein [Natrinema saccharevitans]OLZ39119.1 hypothetical protein A6E15_19340 [Natrinema saccharevitans]
MNVDEFTGAGELPDALAFVAPNRAEYYVAIDRADGPATADDLEDALEYSRPTVYRALNDLQEIGVVTETVRLDPEHGPTTAYETTLPAAEATASPVWDRARTDGGTDR